MDSSPGGGGVLCSSPQARRPQRTGAFAGGVADTALSTQLSLGSHRRTRFSKQGSRAGKRSRYSRTKDADQESAWEPPGHPLCRSPGRSAARSLQGVSWAGRGG